MEIREKIRHFIMRDLCPDRNVNDLPDDYLLLESGLIDSMGILSLLAFLEENFGILLKEEELNMKKFITLQSICDLVSQKLGETQSS